VLLKIRDATVDIRALPVTDGTAENPYRGRCCPLSVSLHAVGNDPPSGKGESTEWLPLRPR